MNHLSNRNGVWAALLVLAVPVLAQTPNLSGFWELRFDSRNVPPAPLTAAMAAEDRGVQFKLDTTAIRWCHFFGVPYMMEGSTIDILQNLNGKEIAITSALRNPTRHIYTDGRGHVNPDTFDPVSNGHSIGHWEGDTLVVDTVGFSNEGITGIPGGGRRTPDSHLDRTLPSSGRRQAPVGRVYVGRSQGVHETAHLRIPLLQGSEGYGGAGIRLQCERRRARQIFDRNAREIGVAA